MRILYTPFSILARQLTRRAGNAALSGVWEQFGAGTAPPSPNAERRGLLSVFTTAALQAAVLAGVGAVVDQLFGRAFHQLFGAWPGKPAAAEVPPPGDVD